MPAQTMDEVIARLDEEVALLGRLVRRPLGVFVNLGLRGIRLRESSGVPRIIDVLSQV